MSTATRPAKTNRQAEPQTIYQRIRAARESYPGLREARQAVLALRSEENSLLAKLQTPPTVEDPHAHDSARTKLAAVREKLGPAQIAEREAEQLASKAAMEVFLPEHLEAASSFLVAITELLKSHAELMDLRTVATSQRLPITATTRFFGCDQLQGLRGQLEAIRQQWHLG